MGGEISTIGVFLARIVGDFGDAVERLIMAERSPTASRCRMPASNGLHPVESTTHNGRCCRAGLRYVWG